MEPNRVFCFLVFFCLNFYFLVAFLVKRNSLSKKNGKEKEKEIKEKNVTILIYLRSISLIFLFVAARSRQPQKSRHPDRA